jgi:hypothetical protein
VHDEPGPRPLSPAPGSARQRPSSRGPSRSAQNRPGGKFPPHYRRHDCASGLVRGRPRGLLRAVITPRSKSSPPHTPHGSARAAAPAEGLRKLKIGRPVGEPQPRVLAAARHLPRQFSRPRGQRGHRRARHNAPPLCQGPREGPAGPDAGRSGLPYRRRALRPVAKMVLACADTGMEYIRQVAYVASGGASIRQLNDVAGAGT